MASVAGPDERIEEARRRWLDASAAATQAREELGRLELEAATARAKAKLEAALEQGGLSPELHGELVVDAARDHGATCARASGISEVSWRGVRVAVASIVARLKAAEETVARGDGRPVIVARDVTFSPVDYSTLFARTETAEREREEARREADSQRELRKRAEVERDAAHERAEKAEASMRSVQRQLSRNIGTIHTESVEDTAERATRAILDKSRVIDEVSADRDSWRQQCEDARSDALRYGRERDDVSAEASTISRRLATARLEMRDLIAHARACIDPEIVSRDPAHARLAALVERIEGA